MRPITLASTLTLLIAGSIYALEPGPPPNPPPATPVPATIEIAEGPFMATFESLQTYKCPDWFRDAKLGFWGIVGPESLPESGDWNARHMYVEGHPQYKFHVEHYGHPSTFGYKDLLPLWKLDKFDPDRLMGLYKNAGAKYFCVLANHHDNWDNWNSKYHRWNSVNVGPGKDVVGLWAKAARKHGLRFGVTEHLGRSYSWFNTNKGQDKKGPYAGVPYDGHDPKYADLYFPPHDDTSASYPKNPPEWWPRQWFYRTRDLIDTYKPDLVYTDGAVPFGEVGRALIAHFYNANVAWHGGKLEAVYNLKDWGRHSDTGEYVDGIGIQDVERGALKGIKEQPWQTDTCIGDWFYKSGLHYKPARMVVCMLADIVSKNGNLLLNIPLKHDGSIDAEEEKVLADMADWIKVNGDAIYGTRPWQIFGEGPHTTGGGHFNEGQYGRMTAKDIRFTTKDEKLYAVVLGWPDDGKVVIRSLAMTAEIRNEIKNVRLLGHGEKLQFAQNAEGLSIMLPEQKPCEHAFALKISGRDLKPVPVPAHTFVVTPDKDGVLVAQAVDAEIHGNSPQYESGGGKDNIGYWGNANDYVSWKVKLSAPGTYEIHVAYSCQNGAEGSEYTVAVGEQSITATSRPTGSWATFASEKIGVLKLEKAGDFVLSVKPKTPPAWKVIGLKSVTLRPTP
ncbi:MAG: alpha-L-fucosidase [Planctomycetota bacterium]|nr:alpha-L-fucosidase [Planctomycetota bacterium]